MISICMVQKFTDISLRLLGLYEYYLRDHYFWHSKQQLSGSITLGGMKSSTNEARDFDVGVKLFLLVYLPLLEASIC